MSGPRLDDPHFRPSRWPLSVSVEYQVGFADVEPEEGWDKHTHAKTVIKVTSDAHTWSVTKRVDPDRQGDALTNAVSKALRLARRDPKWRPRAEPRY